MDDLQEHYFTVLVNDAHVPVVCDMDESGVPHNMESADDDRVFDNFKDLKIKVRRKDPQGYEREHDARMCASRILNNGNADFRIEFSDVYLSLYQICRAVAYMTYKYQTDVPMSYTNDEVIAYAVSNI